MLHGIYNSYLSRRIAYNMGLFMIDKYGKYEQFLKPLKRLKDEDRGRYYNNTYKNGGEICIRMRRTAFVLM